MKNRVIFIISVVISFILGMFIFSFFVERKMCDQKSHEVEIIRKEKLFLYSKISLKLPKKGLVTDEKLAVHLAKIYFSSIFGKESQSLFQKRFTVKLENDIWIIEGNRDFQPNEKGGVPHIEIRKSDGAVLHIIHGK